MEGARVSGQSVVFTSTPPYLRLLTTEGEGIPLLLPLAGCMVLPVLFALLLGLHYHNVTKSNQQGRWMYLGFCILPTWLVLTLLSVSIGFKVGGPNIVWGFPGYFAIVVLGIGFVLQVLACWKDNRS